MKNYWKAIGVTAIAAGIIYYPALKLYQYLAKKRREMDEEDGETHVKAFIPAYRGKHKPHHRHSHNGDGNHGA